MYTHPTCSRLAAVGARVRPRPAVPRRQPGGVPLRRLPADRGVEGRGALEDPELEALVDKLAKRYEHGEWRFADQPRDYVASMIGGIVGFEIPMARVEAKFKLSQNRNPADRAGVLAAIAPDHAAFMRRYGAKE